MRRYFDWPSVTVLLVLNLVAEASHVANAETGVGVFETFSAKHEKRSMQQSHEKVGLLRATLKPENATASVKLPTDIRISSRTNDVVGEKDEEGVDIGVVSSSKSSNHFIKSLDSSSATAIKHEMWPHHAKVSNAEEDALGTLYGAEISERSEELQRDLPNKYSGDEEDEMGTIVVDDVYVKWDQTDCFPCGIPTQVVDTFRRDFEKRLQTHFPDVLIDTQSSNGDEEDGDDDQGLKGEYVHCSKVIIKYGEIFECPSKNPSEPDTASPEGTTAPPTGTTTPSTESSSRSYEPAPASSRSNESSLSGSFDDPTAASAAATPSGQPSVGFADTSETPSTSVGATPAAKTFTNTDGDIDPNVSWSTAANTSTSAGHTASTGHFSDNLSSWAIAGIAMGCAVLVALVIGAVLSRQQALTRQYEEDLFVDISDTCSGFETDYAAI